MCVVRVHVVSIYSTYNMYMYVSMYLGYLQYCNYMYVHVTIEILFVVFKCRHLCDNYDSAFSIDKVVSLG